MSIFVYSVYKESESGHRTDITTMANTDGLPLEVVDSNGLELVRWQKDEKLSDLIRRLKISDNLKGND